ncbi:MAG: B12-binding domain-containing radical SAM protein [Polyangiaceae bacterium]|nr:B12-binding domain-containing radical SAM protein [Polyangiaceae bacterium]
MHPRHLVQQRLRDEQGRLDRDAQHRLALAAHRVFAADEPGARSLPDLTYESGLSPNAFAVVAFSIAYELELGELLGMLARADIPVLRGQRRRSDPLVLAGGPLTFGNAEPLGPFVDAVVVGEADGLVLDVLRAAHGSGDRSERLERLAQIEGVWVPSVHGGELPEPACADDAMLPAWGPIRTPHTELRNMFLVEATRGCSRGCSYCVMRRRQGQRGMRVVPADRVLDAIPSDAARVGLVGASVSDHPHIAEIVSNLADRGVHVGLSSMRADRLDEPLVRALRRAGYRTLTTAMDGASERVRALVDRKTTEAQLMAVAGCAREAGIERLKLYLMVGLPGEQDDDIDACAAFVRELSRVIPVSLGVSAFCAKRGTPLDGSPFAGVDIVERRLIRLRRGLAGRADVRATSARWAWVEHVIAQGGAAEGRAVLEAVRAGGRFAAYRRAFEALGHTPSRRGARARG